MIPDPCDTLEQLRRFQHADIPGLLPLDVWAEAEALQQQIAHWTYYKKRGWPIHVVDGAPVYALDWAHDRLARLRKAGA